MRAHDSNRIQCNIIRDIFVAVCIIIVFILVILIIDAGCCRQSEQKRTNYVDRFVANGIGRKKKNLRIDDNGNEAIIYSKEMKRNGVLELKVRRRRKWKTEIEKSKERKKHNRKKRIEQNLVRVVIK